MARACSSSSPSLRLGVRRPEVSKDPTAPIDVLGDLHRCRARTRPDRLTHATDPSVGHQLVPQIPHPLRHHRTSAAYDPPELPRG